MLSKLLSAGRWSVNSTDTASLILRLMLGVFMLTHGYPKLQQLLSGNTQFADPIGIGATASLYLTVFAEFFCSLLLIFGLCTRPALISLMITMGVAAFAVHANDPFGDKEHSLMYLLPYFALFLLGAGKYSLDAMWRKES
jgi:putative oxidoreductase